MKKIFTRTSFFWIVNLVFMAVSVLHAGNFFGITGKDELSHWLGFAVSFFLDLVTIILMQAMLEARYRGEESRARQFLFFIMLCCGTSTFANLAISLNDFDPILYLPHAPGWVQVATPYVLASFPLFVIMMSIAAEMIINVRPLEQLDEGEYEADEKKRLNLITIRNTYLEMQADQELRLLEIRARMKANKLLHRPALSLPWQKQPDPQPVDVDAPKAGLIDEIKNDYDSQVEALKVEYSSQLEALQERIECLHDAQEDEQFEHLFRRPIATNEDAFQIMPSPSIMSTQQDADDEEDEQPDEQESTPIDLDSRRTAHPTDEQEDEPKTNTSNGRVRIAKGDSDVIKAARRIVRKNPRITAQELANKIGKSRAQAGKIRAKILEELGSSEPA